MKLPKPGLCIVTKGLQSMQDEKQPSMDDTTCPDILDQLSSDSWSGDEVFYPNAGHDAHPRRQQEKKSHMAINPSLSPLLLRDSPEKDIAIEPDQGPWLNHLGWPCTTYVHPSMINQASLGCEPQGALALVDHHHASESNQVPSEGSYRNTDDSSPWCPVSPDLTNVGVSDRDGIESKQRASKQPAWRRSITGEVPVDTVSEDNKKLYSRISSYYHGSISVKHIPGDTGKLSPIIVFHSSSASAATSRHTSQGSAVGETSQVDAQTECGGVLLSTIPESPDKAIAPLADLGLFQSATSDLEHYRKAEEGQMGPGIAAQTEKCSTLGPDWNPWNESPSPKSCRIHGGVQDFDSSVETSRVSSLLGSPTVPWSPVSPDTGNNPRWRECQWISERQISEQSTGENSQEVYMPLLADRDFLFSHERTKSTLVAEHMVVATPNNKRESSSANDGDVEDEGELTPLSPDVLVYRRLRRPRYSARARREHRTDSASEVEGSETRKRCASYYDDSILEKIGASPGKKMGTGFEAEEHGC